MTRARVFALFVAAALLIACGTSKVDDNAQVSITGKLLLPGGKPASGVAVALTRQPDGISALVELTVTVSSLGLVCLSKAVAICKDTRKTTTDANGAYSFTMPGKDTKNLLGNASPFLVSARLDSGAQVQTRFEVGSPTMELPETTFWEPSKLSAQPATDFVTYAFTDFNPKPSQYRVVLTRAEETIWSQTGPASGRIDARTLADATADLHAVATVDKNGFATDFHSPPVSVHGVAARPVSRGATCSVAGPSGLVPLSPCTLTDGRYADSFPGQSCPQASPTPATPSPCPANTYLQLDLGTPRPLRAAFAHGLGLNASVMIQSSVDGQTWKELSRRRASAYMSVDLPAGSSGRYVRVAVVEPGSAIYALTEFAVY